MTVRSFIHRFWPPLSTWMFSERISFFVYFCRYVNKRARSIRLEQVLAEKERYGQGLSFVPVCFGSYQEEF